MTRRTALQAGIGVAVLAGAIPAHAAPPKEWQVRDGGTGNPVSWDDLIGKLAQANAVFVGEQHDDPETHKVEATLLEAVHGKVGDRLTLAMEMFERDQQTTLSDYLAGKVSEAEMGKAIRLWPNYPTDYRPMVEYAKAKKVPVVGSNAPQRIVRMVGKEGLATLKSLPDTDKPMIATYVNAPEGDEYAKRFAAIMGEGHGGPSGSMDAATIRRIYEAQCLRDDTMAETVVGLLAAGRTVFHVNGSFHSDAGLGTAARVLWRKPLLAHVAVVKVVATNKTPDFGPLRGEADYLIFVPDRQEKKS